MPDGSSAPGQGENQPFQPNVAPVSPEQPMVTAPPAEVVAAPTSHITGVSGGSFETHAPEVPSSVQPSFEALDSDPMHPGVSEAKPAWTPSGSAEQTPDAGHPVLPPAKPFETGSVAPAVPEVTPTNIGTTHVEVTSSPAMPEAASVTNSGEAHVEVHAQDAAQESETTAPMDDQVGQGLNAPKSTTESVNASEAPKVGDSPGSSEVPDTSQRIESSEVAHGMAEATDSVETFIANLEKLPNIHNKEELLSDLREKADSLAAIAKSERELEVAESQEQARYREKQYSEMMQNVIGKILDAPDAPRKSMINMIDAYKGQDLGGEKNSVDVLYGYAFAREEGKGYANKATVDLAQLEDARKTVYGMFGAEVPADEDFELAKSVRKGEGQLGGIKEVATSDPNVVISEYREFVSKEDPRLDINIIALTYKNAPEAPPAVA